MIFPASSSILSQPTSEIVIKKKKVPKKTFFLLYNIFSDNQRIYLTSHYVFFLKISQMKINKLIITALLISSLCMAQQYDGLKIEKSKVDKNNVIYQIGKTFRYSYSIQKNENKYFLVNNTEDSLTTNELDKNKIDGIKMSVIKPKMFQRTNKNQTEIRYNFEPNPRSRSSTGVVENKENVWIHPPRMGFLNALETCPFPYIKLNKPVGYIWTDKMNIGDHRSNKQWGEWKGRLLLDYTYKIVGKEAIKTSLGSLDCYKIESTAKSNIGESKLVSFYNDKYGFVKLEYTLMTGSQIEINLVEVSE